VSSSLSRRSPAVPERGPAARWAKGRAARSARRRGRRPPCAWRGPGRVGIECVCSSGRWPADHGHAAAWPPHESWCCRRRGGARHNGCCVNPKGRQKRKKREPRWWPGCNSVAARPPLRATARYVELRSRNSPRGACQAAVGSMPAAGCFTVLREAPGLDVCRHETAYRKNSSPLGTVNAPTAGPQPAPVLAARACEYDGVSDPMRLAMRWGAAWPVRRATAVSR
jgi:hypothetical protein